MITFAEVGIGSGLAVICARCAPPTGSVFLPAEEILDAVRTIAEHWESGPGPNITLVGAEPFAHPELPRIISGIAGLGVERIRLRTDGGALAVPGNAEGALHAGVRHLDLVLLAAGPDNDVLAGQPGLFDDAISGVLAFTSAAAEMGANIAITGRVPVCVHNLELLPATVGALAAAGAVAVELVLTQGAAAPKGAADWIAAAIETGTVNAVWVSVAGSGLATVPVSRLHAVAPSHTVVGT